MVYGIFRKWSRRIVSPYGTRYGVDPASTDQENADALYSRKEYAYALRVRAALPLRNRVKCTKRGCVGFTERVNAYNPDCVTGTQPEACPRRWSAKKV